MKFSFPEEEDLGFQIAPLVDIFFLVLIFFMTASIFYQIESELPLNLPVASEGKFLPRTPGKIIINIDRKGTIVINEKSYTLEELENLLRKLVSLFPNQGVIVRGDREVSYGKIISILDVCAEVGIWNISFATIKESKK
ncbi:biopolymer transporter ExbD [Candidatus Calescamantes bacterium]|nr:biopolymer transporter ExbD [Candidatus Calescamantes bacterium]